jgi:hypothetical protein
MKIRSLLALVGLAIGFAVPAFAEQTTTPDPQLRQQCHALVKVVDFPIFPACIQTKKAT